MATHVLVDRYPSKRMRYIFSDENKYTLWREMWVAIADAQKTLGLQINNEQINELKANKNNLNLKRALEIEKVNKHDVIAHKDAFAEQCPNAKSILHLGCTSKDITDNAELLQIKEALGYIKDKLVNCIDYTVQVVKNSTDIMTPGYTHFQIAQATTVGKRLATYGECLIDCLEDLEYRIDNIKFRGVKGAVGTEADQLTLFEGNIRRVDFLNQTIAEKLGFKKIYGAIGQTYPRLFDYQVVSDLAKIVITARKFGTDIRLLQGFGEIEEPFEKGQKGSSAMAQKRNPKNSERMCSISYRVLEAANGIGLMASDQWLEGSVEDSAIRRIDIADAFYATDAVLELYMYIMQGLNVNRKIIARRIEDNLPKIAVNTFIQEAVLRGVDRQVAYERIHGHAMKAIKKYRDGGDYDLLVRIEKDSKLKIGEDIAKIIHDRDRFIGRASEQGLDFVKKAKPILEKYKSILGMEAEVEV